MRYYLEAKEVVTFGEQAEFIRADITGMAEPEVDKVKTAIKDIMSGLTYNLTRHTCLHDEGGTCDMEVEI